MWNGTAWVAQKVAEAQLNLTDVTTANVSSTVHGFAPKSPADATKFLNGAATPAFAQVKGSDLSMSDVTTNNVSTSAHGFAPKLPNDATKYLDGTGAYSVPAGGGGGGGAEIGVNSITSSVTITSGTESAGDTLITASSYTFSGSAVIVELCGPYMSVAASTQVIVCLFEGSTEIGRMGFWNNSSSPVNLRHRFTPSAGAHTYKVTAFLTGAVTASSFGAGTGGTGGYNAAFLRFSYA